MEEENWIFRQKKLRNCLGVIFRFHDCKYVFDVVSNITNQTGLLASNMIDSVMRHPAVAEIFRKQNIRNADMWFDVGTHFRNRAMLYYVFKSIPNLYPQLTNMEYHMHVGGHGKSEVDGHFGFISHSTNMNS